MILGKVDRYTVWKDGGGVGIEMRQTVRALVWIGFVAMVIAIILEKDGIGSLDPWRGRCLGGLGVFLLILIGAALCAEDWRITPDEIRYVCALRGRDERYRRPPASPVALEVEYVPGPEGDPAILGYSVRLIGPRGEDLNCGFQFQTRKHVDRFLELLRSELPLHVDEVGPRNENKTKPKDKPSRTHSDGMEW